MGKTIAAIVTLALVLLVSASADARESVASLKKKLLGHDDFKVRAQAAFALGASGSKQAVDALCKGLGDEKDSVRAAAAGGLGKLALGGKDCLEKRLEGESSSNVKKMIKKAINLVEAAANGPKLTGDTKLYIAVFKAKGDEKRVRAALQRNLAAREGYAIAPESESEADAKKRLRKYPDVVAYGFGPKLTIEKDDDKIVVTLEIAITGYPDTSEDMGNASRTVGRSGIDGEDVEDQLVREACELAMDDFARMAEEVN